MPPVKPVAEGFNTVSVYLTVKGAAEAIAFYAAAFGAEETYRLVGPDGRVGHAEVRIGDSTVMLSDEYPDFGALAPPSVGGSPIKLYLSVPDVDAVAARAVAAGATLIRPVEDQFHGSRSALLADPFGHQWFVSTVIEDVTPDEMQRRWNAAG